MRLTEHPERPRDVPIATAGLAHHVRGAGHLLRTPWEAEDGRTTWSRSRLSCPKADVAIPTSHELTAGPAWERGTLRECVLGEEPHAGLCLCDPSPPASLTSRAPCARPSELPTTGPRHGVCKVA